MHDTKGTAKYTDREIRAMISDWLVRENPENSPAPSEEWNYKQLVDACRYSIVEDYTPGCPGTCGDVLTVVFDGSIGCYEVFTIERGALVTNEKE